MKTLVALVTGVVVHFTLYAYTPTLIIADSWNGQYWVAQARDSFTYNNAGKQVDSFYQVKAASGWQTMSRRLATYNANGYLQDAVQQIYNGMFTEWRNRQLFHYYQNAQGGLSNIFMRSWNSFINDWDTISTREGFTYDNSGNQLEYLKRKGDGTNLLRNTYIYNGGTLQQVIYQTWEGFINDWVSYEQELLTYNSTGRKVSMVLQRWNNNTNEWLNAGKTTYSYNSQGQLSNYITEKCTNYGGSEVWQFNEQFELVYNTDGSPATIYKQLWDKNKSEWINTQRLTYVYPEATGIAPLQTDILHFAPNPVSNKMQVWLNSNTDAVITVTDLQGRTMLRQTTAAKTTELNTSHLPAGTYILAVVQAGNTVQGRFIKQ